MVEASKQPHRIQALKGKNQAVWPNFFYSFGGGEGTHLSIVSTGTDYIMNSETRVPWRIMRTPLSFTIPILVHPYGAYESIRGFGFPHMPLGIAVVFTLRFHR